MQGLWVSLWEIGLIFTSACSNVVLAGVHPIEIHGFYLDCIGKKGHSAGLFFRECLSEHKCILSSVNCFRSSVGLEASHCEALFCCAQMNPKGHSFDLAGSVRLVSFDICLIGWGKCGSQCWYLCIMGSDWFLMFLCPSEWNKSTTHRIGILPHIISFFFFAVFGAPLRANKG